VAHLEWLRLLAHCAQTVHTFPATARSGARPPQQSDTRNAAVDVGEPRSRCRPAAPRLGFDASKPDGRPRKLMDVSRLAALGWRAGIGLEEGLRDAYGWFLKHRSDARL
jgi:nucleoside-diphosphate-sugar epimerase